MKAIKVCFGHSQSMSEGVIIPIALIVVLCVVMSCNSTGSDPDPSSVLADTGWHLQSFGGEAPPGDQKYNLSFVSENEFGGRSDCNSIGGSYKAFEDSSISFETIHGTLVACGTDSIGEEFTRWLQAANTFKVKGDRLTISTDEGDLTFNRSSDL